MILLLSLKLLRVRMQKTVEGFVTFFQNRANLLQNLLWGTQTCSFRYMLEYLTVP